MPFSAIVELQPSGSCCTHHRAIAIRRNAEDDEQHADMGFDDGWGAALDQLVEVMEAQ